MATFTGNIVAGEVVTLIVDANGAVQEKRYTRPAGATGFPQDADGRVAPAPAPARDWRDGRGGRGQRGNQFDENGPLPNGWTRNADGSITDPKGEITHRPHRKFHGWSNNADGSVSDQEGQRWVPEGGLPAYWGNPANQATATAMRDRDRRTSPPSGMPSNPDGVNQADLERQRGYQQDPAANPVPAVETAAERKARLAAGSETAAERDARIAAAGKTL